jgi:hypothetical protein
MEFMQERWKGKMPVLAGFQLAQEEINRATHFLSANIGEMLAAKRYTSDGG